MPFIAPTSDVEILADYEGIAALARRTGTTAAGTKRKPRYTIEMKSEPILLNFDPYVLSNGPADALRAVISDQIRLNPGKVANATKARRARRAVEFAAGLPTALKRYSGGRTGAKPPNPSSDQFAVDSGRLHEGIFVRQNRTDKSYTVNVPASRLTTETGEFTAGDLSKFFARLVSLVPALDARYAANLPAVKRSVDEAINLLITKAEDVQRAKLQALRKAQLQLLRTAANLVLG